MMVNDSNNGASLNDIVKATTINSNNSNNNNNNNNGAGNNDNNNIINNNNNNNSVGVNADGIFIPSPLNFPYLQMMSTQQEIHFANMLYYQTLLKTQNNSTSKQNRSGTPHLATVTPVPSPGPPIPQISPSPTTGRSFAAALRNLAKQVGPERDNGTDSDARQNSPKSRPNSTSIARTSSPAHQHTNKITEKDKNTVSTESRSGFQPYRPEETRALQSSQAAAQLPSAATFGLDAAAYTSYHHAAAAAAVAAAATGFYPPHLQHAYRLEEQLYLERCGVPIFNPAPYPSPLYGVMSSPLGLMTPAIHERLKLEEEHRQREIQERERDRERREKEKTKRSPKGSPSRSHSHDHSARKAPVTPSSILSGSQHHASAKSPLLTSSSSQSPLCLVTTSPQSVNKQFIRPFENSDSTSAPINKTASITSAPNVDNTSTLSAYPSAIRENTISNLPATITSAVNLNMPLDFSSTSSSVKMTADNILVDQLPPAISHTPHSYFSVSKSELPLYPSMALSTTYNYKPPLIELLNPASPFTPLNLKYTPDPFLQSTAGNSIFPNHILNFSSSVTSKQHKLFSNNDVTDVKSSHTTRNVSNKGAHKPNYSARRSVKSNKTGGSIKDKKTSKNRSNISSDRTKPIPLSSALSQTQYCSIINSQEFTKVEEQQPITALLSPNKTSCTEREDQSEQCYNDGSNNPHQENTLNPNLHLTIVPNELPQKCDQNGNIEDDPKKYPQNSFSTELTDRFHPDEPKCFPTFGLVSHTKRNEIELNILSRRRVIPSSIEKVPSEGKPKYNDHLSSTSTLPEPKFYFNDNDIYTPDKVCMLGNLGLKTVADEERINLEIMWREVLADRSRRNSLTSVDKYCLENIGAPIIKPISCTHDVNETMSSYITYAKERDSESLTLKNNAGILQNSLSDKRKNVVNLNEELDNLISTNDHLKQEETETQSALSSLTMELTEIIKMVNTAVT